MYSLLYLILLPLGRWDTKNCRITHINTNMNKVGSVPEESNSMYKITLVQFGHFGVLLVRGVYSV